MVLSTLIACLCIFLSVAQGFEIYLARIPNADKLRQSNGRQEAVGHVNPAGDGPRNTFGNDFAKHGSSWNSALCEADSDGDGLTNGEELGDPLCIWTRGETPTRTTGITHPGICQPADSEKCLGIAATQPNVTEGSDESEDSEDEESETGEMEEEEEEEEPETDVNKGQMDNDESEDPANNVNNPLGNDAGDPANNVNGQPNTGEGEAVKSGSLTYDLVHNTGAGQSVPALIMACALTFSVICRYFM